MFSHLVADIAYALRGFAARPGFASIIVLTLGCGIAVNATIFSVFEQLLIRDLPVSDPDGLVNLASPGVRQGSTSCNDSGSCDEIFSYPMFRDLERVDGPFAGMAAHRSIEANFALDGRTFYGRGSLVSGSYFSVLGLQPAFGRLLGSGDDAVAGEASSVVLSYSFWENALGADEDAVGRVLIVNGEPLTIVGVAPRGFHGTTIGARAQVFVPITFRWRAAVGAVPNFDDRRVYWTYLFARLRQGVTAEAATAAINAPYQTILNDVEAPLQRMSEQTLAAFKERRVTLAPGGRGQSSVPGRARAPLQILLLATGLVLLIACVNIANLMLARGATRANEMAVRVSLGAGAGRLAALLSVEVLLLASVAAVVSLPLTLVCAQAIGSMLPAFAADDVDFSLNRTALLATCALALVSALVFGLLPILRVTRSQPGVILKSQGGRGTGDAGSVRFRAMMITTQIALSMTLLILAGWFAESLANVAREELGFRTEAIATFSIAPERNGYTGEQSAALFDRLERELAQLPGVTAAASALVPLVDNSSWGSSIRIEGIDLGPDSDTNVAVNYVSGDFFRTVGMPLVTGNDLASAQTAARPSLAVVNERFVDKFGLGSDIVGRHLALGGRDTPLGIEIVGLVRDAKYADVKGRPPAEVFLPRVQLASMGEASFYVQSELAPRALRSAVERVVADADPNLPIMSFRMLDDVVRENVFLDRFMSVLAAALAALATALAALGIYGVLSYNLVQRTREIGLRLALGASPQRMRRMVLRQVGSMTVLGGLLGIAAALVLGRLAAALLFGLETTDLRVLLLAALALLATVGMAGYWPARRASRIDPMVALRHD